MYVIFDLDGTLANIETRRKMANARSKMDWDTFNDPTFIWLDLPNTPVIAMFHALQQNGYVVGIFSGRLETSRTQTMSWLDKHDIHPSFFRMREENDYTPDDQLKERWLSELTNDYSEILAVYDDRDKVVRMWRSHGITCFQVATGNF